VYARAGEYADEHADANADRRIDEHSNANANFNANANANAHADGDSEQYDTHGDSEQYDTDGHANSVSPPFTPPADRPTLPTRLVEARRALGLRWGRRLSGRRPG